MVTGASADTVERGPTDAPLAADGPGPGDGDGADGATGAQRRWWAAVRYPVVTFAKVAAMLWVVSWFSIEFLDRHPAYLQAPAVFRGTQLAEGWFRWDGNWYRLIITEGYFFTAGKQSSVAFFPAYPMTAKLLSKLTGDVILTLIVVSLVSGLAVAVLFYRWCARRTSPASAALAVLVLLLYPYAWYLFGAAYADALFLASALGAFVLLDRGHPVLAGLVGMVATAARPVGTGVFVGLAAVMLEQRGVVVIPALERVKAHGWKAWRREPSPATGAADPEPGEAVEPVESRAGRSFLGVRLQLRNLRLADLGVFLSILGLVAWCVYLWRTWGNPFLFAETESAPGWDQSAGFRTWLKIPWFENLGQLPQWIHDTIWPVDVRGYAPWSQTIYTVGITVQAAFVFGALALVPRVLRRVGWGYALYVLCVVAIPLLGSKDFQGTGRYMLAAFPCFLVAAEWLGTHDRWRRVWLPVSGAALVYLTSLFARGYYIA